MTGRAAGKKSFSAWNNRAGAVLMVLRDCVPGAAALPVRGWVCQAAASETGIDLLDACRTTEGDADGVT
jgi:hypothetical protein